MARTESALTHSPRNMFCDMQSAIEVPDGRRRCKFRTPLAVLPGRPTVAGFVVGGGVDDAIYLFARHGSQFVATGKIPLGHEAGLGDDVLPQAARVAAGPDGPRALVANYCNDSVSLIDLTRKTVVAEKYL